MILIVIAAVWLIFGRTRMQSFWNPKTWWDKATGEAGSIASSVKNWTLGIVRDAVNLVSNDVNDAVGLSVRFFSTAYGYAQKAESEASSWAGHALSYAEGAFGRAEHDALSWANNALHWAQSAFGRAEHDALAWANNALSWAQTAFSRAEHDALSWANNALTWAEKSANTLTHYAETLYNDALGYARKVAADAYSEAYKAVNDDFIKPFASYWTIIKKAFTWLIWMAENPLETLKDSETGLIHWAESASTDGLRDVSTGLSEDVIAEFAKILGL